MSILVTGATGTIGSLVVQGLASAGAQVSGSFAHLESKVFRPASRRSSAT